VHLNQVMLDVNGVSGAGNLLGKLLCSVSNLLNQSPVSQETSALLNIVQQRLNVPTLQGL
jgi:hypothetical protein